MTDLGDYSRIGLADHGLCVLSTLRPDASIQSSVVNAGVLDHPITGTRVIGLVAAGGTRKLANMRRDPRVSVVAKSGWEWVAAEGNASLWGPDDPITGVGADELRLALREVFRAAGGTHDDWDEYDRVMAEQRRTAVFIAPERVYSNQ
jgi:PPOX class probable F420-dependent enzyme